jgi:hypothetical protein
MLGLLGPSGDEPICATFSGPTRARHILTTVCGVTMHVRRSP